MVPIILRECACGITSFVFASTVFCVVAKVTSPVFLLSNVKENKLHALLIKTAFPDTYAALSEPVLFARVKYYLSLRVCAKISSTPTHVNIILQMQ